MCFIPLYRPIGLTCNAGMPYKRCYNADRALRVTIHLYSLLNVFAVSLLLFMWIAELIQILL